MLEQRIVIISAGWNCGSYVDEWYQSIVCQKYNNFVCLAIDDNSDDDTFLRILKCAKEDKRFIVLKNTERKWGLYNKSVALIENGLVDDNDIIVGVDIDDCLSGDMALWVVNRIFGDVNLWFSYGNMRPHKNVCLPLNWSVPIRKQTWRASHLRACRMFLMKNILKKDLQDSNGNWLKYPEDRILCYPMLEMAGQEHVWCNRVILYHHRNDNPQCDFRVNQKQIDNTLSDLIQQPPYKEKTHTELMEHENDWL